MNSNRKTKSTFTDKKEQKLVRYFNSKLSKDNNRIKPKKIFPNKEKKPKVDIISPPKHISQNPNKTSTKLITPNETNSKIIKKIIPKNNFKLKEISENQHSKKKDENFISTSSITKNKFLLEEKNINNTIINNIENNSNIHIGSNNKITIIKNIFSRGNKPLWKNKNQNKKIMVPDIKMRIIKLKNKNNYTISGNAKKSKKIYKGVRNTSRKKMINRQSLSTYNSIDNLNNENNYFLTSNNKNIIHCNTISNNLKLSSNIKNYKNKLCISLENSKKKFYMNLSHSNFLNTCPSLTNCKSDVKHKIKNIKTIKTLSINADHKYKKIYHNIKRKKFQKKINLIRCLNKLASPKLILKNKISSTIGNNYANYIQEKDNENNEKSINNNESISKGTIDNLKSKKNCGNNFYEKIKKINLKSVRSKSINVNLIKNAKHKKYNSDINNNNNSSLMNVRLNNKIYQLNLKNIELSENKHLKNKISPSIRNNNNNKSNQNYYETIHKLINPPLKSLNSINNPDEKNKKNSSDLKDKIKIINEFYKSKDSLIEKNNNKLIENIPIKKYNTNLNNNETKKDNFEEKNNLNNNMEIEEDQIFNNINQNSLTMYSIYILSKYNKSYDKIGLSQIYLYDNKNVIIPVLYSNSKCDSDSSSLFYSVAKPVKISNKQTKYSTIKKQNHPFICEFKQNLYINFFVKNIQSNNIHHIKIINYYNRKQKISASKDIKIYQGNLLLYEGILSVDKPNIINFTKKVIEKEKNEVKYIDKNINSTLSTTSRKHFSFINSNNSNTNIKKKLNSPENNYNSPKANKSNKNENIRKCLFGQNKSQNKLISNKIMQNKNITKEQNYVKFEDICIVIVSNYGHKEYVGLTGIEFIDNKGKIINIEKAKTIGALPKDLYTIYNDEKEKRIFENIFNGDNNTNDMNSMWVTKLMQNDKKNNSLISYSYIELSFYDKICLSKIKIYNYNDKSNLDICARELKIFFDSKYYGTIVLRQGVGEKIFGSIGKDTSESKNNEDYSQEITFPLKNIELDDEYIYKQISKNKFSSLIFKQNYETPYLPCGHIIKFQLNNNYSYPRNKYFFGAYEDLFIKYKVIGLDNIEIYNENGINVLNTNNNYKIISNCEILNDELKNNNKILLNGTQNENGNNCLFYIFENPIFLSYIKFFPLRIKDNVYSENTVKNFKIFCDNLIIFEGVMNKNKPSIVYFSSDIQFVNTNIDDNCFIQYSKNRTIKEEKNSIYISLTLN